MEKKGKLRELSYGEQKKPTVFDRFGVYLSSRRMRKELVTSALIQNPGTLIDLGGGIT